MCVRVRETESVEVWWVVFFAIHLVFKSGPAHLHLFTITES